MERKAYFYIDDVIWVFRDLTRERPKSMFDNHFMKVLKEAHDQYGLKVMLNVFWRTDYFYGNDEFTLAEMTDAYTAEWEAASDWIKIAFHAKQEFPDYPHINMDYEDMKQLYADFKNAVLRFAGEGTLSQTFNPHWTSISKDGCRALCDLGVRMCNASYGDRKEYNGDPASLPYGHAARLLNNRKPETMLFSRGTADKAIDSSLCGYNHLPKEIEEKTKFNLEIVKDEEFDLYYKRYFNGLCLNLCSSEDLDDEMAKYIGKEYIGAATHEQYSYPDYYNYHPDQPEKIMRMCKTLTDNGYTFFFVEDLLPAK